MNNEWKELDINNLPPDILVGDYEFEKWTNGAWKPESYTYRTSFLTGAANNGVKYRYRKRPPKAPSHAEIMTKWWKLPVAEDENVIWAKVEMYRSDCAWREGQERAYFIGGEFRRKSYFTSLESADTPPLRVNMRGR